jgi:inorganic pyrophosphatase
MNIIGQKIHIVIDRPLGSTHPKHKNIVYEVNYGYTPDFVGGDGEEQDVCLLGVNEPITEFDGVLVAIIHRENDTEEKWVVAPENTTFSADEIMKAVNFQEKYFKSSVQLV